MYAKEKGKKLIDILNQVSEGTVVHETQKLWTVEVVEDFEQKICVKAETSADAIDKAMSLFPDRKKVNLRLVREGRDEEAYPRPIASSPFIHDGTLRTRIVLKEKVEEYVTHKEIHYPEGEVHYDHGNYFSFKSEGKSEALKRAWKDFVRRSNRMLGVD